MKNKEIEEILNKMKNCNGVFDYYLEYGEVDLLLSYIEQLQTTANECKQDYQRMKENFDSKVDVIATLSKEKKQLENNRDKAIEYVKEFRFATVKFEQHSDTLLNILEGDSDD